MYASTNSIHVSARFFDIGLFVSSPKRPRSSVVSRKPMRLTTMTASSQSCSWSGAIIHRPAHLHPSCAVIKKPMDLGTVLKKVKAGSYKTKTQFSDDLELIWSNCLLYNSYLVSRFSQSFIDHLCLRPITGPSTSSSCRVTPHQSQQLAEICQRAMSDSTRSVEERQTRTSTSIFKLFQQTESQRLIRNLPR